MLSSSYGFITDAAGAFMPNSNLMRSPSGSENPTALATTFAGKTASQISPGMQLAPKAKEMQSPPRPVQTGARLSGISIDAVEVAEPYDMFA